MSTLTINVGGSNYPILTGSFSLDDTIDERSTVSFILREDLGIFHFQKGQQISATDSTLGLIFAGFVHTPSEQKLPPSTTILHTIDIIDMTWIPDKRTVQNLYSGYAGNIVTALLQDILQAEGITASYASRVDSTQASFAAGTLVNTAATSFGGGDLELSPAGTSVTIAEKTTADFAAGALSNVTAANNSLTPTATNAIKFSAQMLTPASGNTYNYQKIWQGSIVVASNDFFNYDIWIDPICPQAFAGVDIVFSDGTNVRDTAINFDVQNLPPHPHTDLAGVAIGQWYHRNFYMNHYTGKTVAYVTVAFEGDNTGTYLAYFKNIYWQSTSNTYFFQTSLNVNPSQSVLNNGYSNVSLTVVPTYDISSGLRVSTSHSISAVALLQESFITWTSVEPAGTQFILKYSIDGGLSYLQCTKNAPMPALIAGMSLAGKSLQFAEEFAVIAGAAISPEITPKLTSLTALVAPSYAATKADVLYSVVTAGGWTAAGTSRTLTFVQSGADLTLTAHVRNFDDGDSSNQTLYGASGPSIGTNQRTLQLGSNTGTDAKSRADFATNVWIDQVIEVDILVTTGVNTGMNYRTTNWVNANNTFAYLVDVNPTQMALGRGSNSGASGTYTSIATATLTLASGQWHHLKIAITGTNHKVYLDDVLLINATDGTFTGSGYVGFHLYNGSGTFATTSFDNFGVCGALTGTWQSPNTSLTSAGTYGTSVITWRDISTAPTNTSLLVQSSLNGGSTWQTCTNGAPIPNFTAAQSLSGVNLTLKVTLTTSTASALPGIDQLTALVTGAYSASGTRVSPILVIGNVGRAGSTIVSWNANTPTGTTLGVDSSLDAVTWTPVSNGGAIAGITVQPASTYDGFSTNTSANYTSTFGTGGGSPTWTYDTTNSKVTAAGGGHGLFLNNALTGIGDVDMYIDLSRSDGGGLAWRYTNASTYYYTTVDDDTSSSTHSVITLLKMSGGVATQLAQGSIVFPRFSNRRHRVTMIGGVITCYLDGVQTLTYTDGSPLAAGKVGLANDFGTAIFYQFFVQPLGQDLTGKSAYTRLRLASTDATVTPQALDLTLAVRNPDIQTGSLITGTDYRLGTVSAALDDLAKRSNYWWYLKKDPVTGSIRMYFNARNAQPSPWIASTSNLNTINGVAVSDIQIAGCIVTQEGDLYRNRQTVKGCISSTTQADPFTGDGTNMSFSLQYPPITPPTIMLNGQAKTVGLKGTTGSDFYYSLNDQVVAQDTAGLVLQLIDTLLISYTGSYETNITVDNTSIVGTTTQAMMAALDGTTGIVEMVEDVTGQGMSAADAITLATSLLTKYGVIGRTITFTTMHQGLAPGQFLTLFVPEHGIVDAGMLILDVQTSVLTQAGGQAFYQWTIKASEGPNLGSWQKMLAQSLS